MELKEFLSIYNFRNYRDDVNIESEKYDTNIIRIYFDEQIGSNHYVEFGVYDFGEDEYKEDIFKSFINKDILKRKIINMYFNYDINTFCIHLENE